MTREEAKEVFLNRGIIDGIYNGDKWREACIVISKWLEQEPVLDKIRAKIEEPLKINQGLNTESAKAQAIALNWVLEVIDKYKAESED